MCRFVPRDGHLFRLEKARLLLLPSDLMHREQRMRTAAAVASPRQPAHRISEDDGTDDEDDDGAFGFVSKFKSASKRLITSALFSGSVKQMAQENHEGHGAGAGAKSPRMSGSKMAFALPTPPPPSMPPLSKQRSMPPLRNLSDTAANARMKQAKSMGMLVVIVEAIVSFSGTMSLWPHLVAILPGTVAIQQYITALLKTCVIAASAGVAQTTADGEFRGA